MTSTQSEWESVEFEWESIKLEENETQLCIGMRFGTDIFDICELNKNNYSKNYNFDASFLSSEKIIKFVELLNYVSCSGCNDSKSEIELYFSNDKTKCSEHVSNLCKNFNVPNLDVFNKYLSTYLNSRVQHIGVKTELIGTGAIEISSGDYGCEDNVTINFSTVKLFYLRKYVSNLSANCEALESKSKLDVLNDISNFLDAKHNYEIKYLTY